MKREDIDKAMDIQASSAFYCSADADIRRYHGVYYPGRLFIPGGFIYDDYCHHNRRIQRGEAIE